MERFLRESDDEDENGIPRRSESKQQNVKKAWDKAKLLPPDDESLAFEDDQSYLLVIKILKVISYLATFVVVLAGTVISKSAFLLMTSQLNPDRLVPFCNNLQPRVKLEAHNMPLERILWSWAIFFSYAFAEILVFIRAGRIWLFKPTFRPTFLQFIIPFACETLHALGLSILAYAVLPTTNVLRGAMMTNAVCFLPALLSLLSRKKYDEEAGKEKLNAGFNWLILASIDGFLLVGFVGGYIIWSILTEQPLVTSSTIALSLILISFGWWENYADRKSSFWPIRWLGNLNLGPSRYVTYLIIPIWKIGIFLVGMIGCAWLLEHNINHYFDYFEVAFNRHNINVTEVRPVVFNGTEPIVPTNQFYGFIQLKNSIPSAVYYVMGAQMLGALATYIAGKFACKIGIQSFSFAFPLMLGVPATLLSLTGFCMLRNDNTCFWSSLFPNYLYWECPKGQFLHDFLLEENNWVWIYFIVGQGWLTLHCWNPKFRRMERGEFLFVTPMYSGLIVDQSLVLNRRKREVFLYDYIDDEDNPEANSSQPYKELRAQAIESVIHMDDAVPKIFACATMWHETMSEMMEMLKSIYRMDEDQAGRRIARKYFAVLDPDYYEIETHIFFDDAFNKEGTTVNSFVKDFVQVIEKAGTQIHEVEVRLTSPKKFPTPYGGRLEWTLPGGTKLFLHLKNKNKIRHKKRWSQCMYMYYLLGHRLLERDLPIARKEVISQNTFILALDGDIDFKPEAVRLLVDLMKKNRALGAACGRIHPVGTGFMIWYQRFEYAIGHWFQKATEHVIGCVLCSPGCFTLFRGSALLDTNVMAKYTTISTEPVHYVQYDQGEDRWLCTLLLQQGYRVEYSAASDAYTHAPEVFAEFFTQRRRWVPSTMANIIDLLVDYKRTIRKNPDVSAAYIGYLTILMVGSVLGPGSIFLMLIGAFNAAFGIPNIECLLWNLLPLSIFVAACFFTPEKFQILVAQILSAVYALIMVAVLVALVIQVQEDGLLSPTTLFLILVASSFIIAAILHPLEFGCLPYGLVYYITIPAMYMLLIIYSLMNMNIVSWGTREVVEKLTPAEEAAAELAKQAAASKPDGFRAYLSQFMSSKSNNDTKGSFEFSCAGLFKLMCCTQEDGNEDKQQLAHIASNLSDINRRLENMERPSGSVMGERRRSMAVTSPISVSVQEQYNQRIVEQPSLYPTIDELDEEELDEAASFVHGEQIIISEPERRDDLVNPEWIDDPDLKNGDVDFLTGAELTFWKEMMEKYLLPLDKDAKKEQKAADDLKELRNRVVFSFFMLNAVFVVAIFLLQNQQETIFIEWPLGATYNMTYAGDNIFNLQKNSLELEPIGVLFVLIFGVILTIQFIAMLVHRLGTFSHILSSTNVEWCSRDVDSVAKELAWEREGLNLIRGIQKLKTTKGDMDGRKSRTTARDVARRQTIRNLEAENEKTIDLKPTNLEAQFHAKFQQVSQSLEMNNKVPGKFGRESRVTFQNLARRRSQVMQRSSSIFDGGNPRISGIGSVVNESIGRTSRSSIAYNNPAFDP